MSADIPLYGLGTWKIARDRAQEVVYTAIVQHGVRHIDCASDYGNEVEVGRGIAQAIAEGVVKRDDLWITSKLWNTYHRQEHVRPACERSLRDLQLTHFDLYLIHFPIALKFVPFENGGDGLNGWIHDPTAANPRVELDMHAPMHLTYAAMEALVEAGLTRHIGVSNFNVQLLMDVLSYAKVPPFCNQVEIHPYNTQEALIGVCRRYGVKVVAFSPLGANSYIELGSDCGLRLLEEPAIKKIADAHSKTPAQVALRWNIQNGIVVIPKTSSTTHLAENLDIFDFSLTEDELKNVSALNANKRFNDPGVYGVYFGQSMPIFN